MGSAVLDLEWKAAALADLLAIVDYISDDNPDAAQALKNEIEAKAARLPKNPRLYRKGRVEGTREMVVRPSYVVMLRTLVLSPSCGCCTRLRNGHEWSQSPEIIPLFRLLFQSIRSPGISSSTVPVIRAKRPTRGRCNSA